MLKIKDNVNLKKLEKFGFSPKYDQYTGELVEMYRISGDKIGTTINYEKNFYYNGFFTVPIKNFWKIFSKDRIIEAKYCWKVNLSQYDYEILYDLIKADLIEKVVE